jgi:hypothetical protein
LLVNRSFPADEVPSKPAVITSSVIAASAGTANVIDAPTRSPVAPFQAVAATPSTSWEGRSLVLATVDETRTAEGPPHSTLTGAGSAAARAEADGAPEAATAIDGTEAAGGGDDGTDERVQAASTRRATGAERRIGGEGSRAARRAR